ncbi:PhzF family phenazine biosynthesis protein [Abyssisolibacter fermentans]|uniref:PhzF family phenazine biosynthesis protein n=1 Tax=Abyssisolibacter fermentans TaxID=1766203 RepID=UPI00082BD248|nr:PhzF family phenazine biosynthesis protein [Abyssisolibacter fermentans]
MKNKVYRMSSFAKTIDGGNPAGVVLDADLFSDSQMKMIAKEVGYSETAFVMKSNKADFKVRFFTPVNEVDLCGHATIATFNLLRNLGVINEGCYTQETKAGVLKLKVYKDNVYMQQNKPKFYEIINREELKACFTNLNEVLHDELPIQIVSTGIKDIILPIKSLDILLNIKPNLEKIGEISKKYDVTGIHAFCLQSYNASTAHCRNFAPLYGIDEESATGTANGALACYLKHYMKDKIGNKLVFEQGYCMNMPSEIAVELVYKDDEIHEVFVGGNALKINRLGG